MGLRFRADIYFNLPDFSKKKPQFGFDLFQGGPLFRRDVFQYGPQSSHLKTHYFTPSLDPTAKGEANLAT